MIITLTNEKEQQIKPILSRLYNAASDYMEGSIKNQSRRNWKFYHGTLPEPSHASMMPAIDRTCYQLTEAALKDLIEIFTASEDCVSFAPINNQDVYSAKAATQLVNQIMMRNQGKALTQDALKTSLVEGFAIIKAYFADDEVETHTVHEKNIPTKEEILHYIVGLRDSGVHIEDEDIEIIENEEGTFDVTVTYSIHRESVKVELLPSEEFVIEPGTKSIEDSSYMCHRVLKTKEQLKSYGLTDEELEAISDDESDYEDYTLKAARSNNALNMNDNDAESEDPGFRVWVKEHHWKTGMISEDGSVRRYKLIQIAEGRIIHAEETFSFPFYVWNPIPLPNSVFGYSFVASISDLQCDRAWAKQTWHTYTHKAALPSWQVVDDAFKGGDLMNPKPNAIYRVTQANAISPMPMAEMPPLDGLISLIDKDKEERTGINSSTAGLSSSGIETNRSSEATVNNMITLATGRVRQMAHSICNGGYREMFKAIYSLYKDNSSRATPVLTAYGVQDIHPSQLVDRDHLTINVALTTQEKNKRFANLQTLIDVIARVTSVQSPFIQPQHQAWLISEAGSLLGYKNTFDFSVPLQQYQAPGIDPATQVQLENVQADTQLKQAQANKLVAEDHHIAEMNLFEQQRASKQEARADKELEMKAAYNSDYFNLENNKLAVHAQSEAAKTQHNQERQANEMYKSQTANLKVQGAIIQKAHENEIKQKQGVEA